MNHPRHSLRARLLLLLLAAIVATAAVQAAIAYRAAHAEADAIFDYHMQQMALALRNGLWPGGSPANPLEHFDDDRIAGFVVQVWTADGLQLFRSARTELPQWAELGFADVPADGTTYRVFSMQSREQIIQVAQDMAQRREIAEGLALRAAAPIAILAPLLMLVVWWVISASLEPVSRVQRQLAQREADELGEVSEAGLPDEIQPLVHELNMLFGRVRRAFDAQHSFVGDAAHELRSPLAALKLQVQGLQRAGSDAARDVAVARLNAGIDRATRLIEQLLVLARYEASVATRTKPQALDLPDIVRTAIAEAAPAARAHGIDLGMGRADDAQISGHADALHILLRNLLDNAIKYTPPGGKVDVEVVRIGDRVVLSVDDSGPGIFESERERVLDRFYRVAGTETTGSGLGLAIVKTIAELHGATLRLDRSAALGGLRVEVSLPAGS